MFVLLIVFATLVSSLVCEVLLNCAALYLFLVLLLCEILLDRAALNLLLVYYGRAGCCLLLALGNENSDEVIKLVKEEKNKGKNDAKEEAEGGSEEAYYVSNSAELTVLGTNADNVGVVYLIAV